MFTPPSNVDDLIRRLREHLRSGKRDISAFRNAVNALRQQVSEADTDRLDAIEKDFALLKKNAHLTLDDLLAELWLFTPEALPWDEAAPADDDDYAVVTDSPWLTPAADALADDAPAAQDDYAGPSGSAWSAAADDAPAPDDAPDDQAEARPVLPIWGSPRTGAPPASPAATDPEVALFDEAEQSLAATPPDFVRALLLLDSITDPRNLTSDEFVRYQTLRQRTIDDRDAERDRLRQIAKNRDADTQLGLAEVVAALDALLDARLTHADEEPEARQRRDLLSSDAWPAEKGLRYLDYFRKANARSFPSLERRLEWLREQRPSLEAIDKAGLGDVSARAAAALAPLVAEIEQLGTSLGKVMSRVVDFDYLGTWRILATRQPHEILQDMPLEGGQTLSGETVEQVRVRLLEEYAEHTFLQAESKFLAAVGSEGERLLTLAPEAALASLRLNPAHSLDIVGKDIALALINVKPTVYLAQFPGMVDESQDRSLDPDVNSLPANLAAKRGRFISLRDHLLPGLWALYERAQDLSAQNTLPALYALMAVYAHADVLKRAKALEEALLREVQARQAEHDRTLASGDFWEVDGASLEDYVAEKTEPLDRLPFLSVALPADHPHTARLNYLREQVANFRAAYADLPRLYERMAATKGRLETQIASVRTRIAERDNAADVDGSITNARAMVESLRTTYHIRVTRFKDDLDALSAENNARRNAQQVLDDAKTSTRELLQREGSAAAPETLAEAWRQLSAKTIRFENAADDAELDALRVRTLHHFATLKANVFKMDAFKVGETAERARLGASTVESLEAFITWYDGHSQEVTRVVTPAHLADLQEQVATAAAKANAAEQNAKQVKDVADELVRDINNVEQTARLLVYAEHYNRVTSKLQDSQSEGGLRMALQEHREGVVTSFNSQLKLAIDEFVRLQGFETGLTIAKALDWARRNSIRRDTTTSDEQFWQRYNQIASGAFAIEHQRHDRDFAPIFDLPFPPSEYRTWYQPLRFVQPRLGDAPNPVGPANVAAYFLVSRAAEFASANEEAKALAWLQTVISLSLGVIAAHPDVPADTPEAAACKEVRPQGGEGSVYILRDAVLLLYAERCRRIFDGGAAADDGLAAAAQEQISQLMQSSYPVVRIIGEMWGVRITALEQLARRDYAATRRTIRRFNRNDTFKPANQGGETPQQPAQARGVSKPIQLGTDEWMRRRHHEINTAMQVLLQKLLGQVGLTTGLPNDPVGLKDALTAAVFLHESSEDNARQLGETMLRDLDNAATMGSIGRAIAQELDDILQDILPRSLRDAAQAMAALNDELNATLEEVAVANMTNTRPVRDMAAKVATASQELATAVAAMEQGLKVMRQVLADEDGVNQRNEWNEGRVAQYLAAAAAAISNAENQAAAPVQAAQRGVNDFGRFQNAVGAMADCLTKLRTCRAEVKGRLTALTTQADPLTPLAEAQKWVEDAWTDVDYLNQQLNAFGMDAPLKVPDAFFTTALDAPIQGLADEITRAASDPAGVFTGRVTVFTGLAPQRTGAWLQEWRQNKTALTTISSLRDHVLITWLLRERAERWHTAMAAFVSAYTAYHPAWLKAATWYAYDHYLIQTIVDLNTLPDAAELPDTDAFSRAAFALLELRLPVQPAGRRDAIKPILTAYSRAAGQLRASLAELDALGGFLPAEMAALWQEALRVCREAEAQAVAGLPNPLTGVSFPDEGLNLLEVFANGRAWKAAITQATTRLDRRDAYLGAAGHGLAALDQHIRQHYLPMIDESIAGYQVAIQAQGNARRRQELEREMQEIEKVRKLLNHDVN